MADKPSIIVLTGKQQTGKTTTCQRIVEAARSEDRDLAGITCPAVFEQAHKTAIDVLDLRANRLKRLAQHTEEPQPGGLSYRFDDQVMAWANNVVETACPCDILMIDEIGRLEIEQGRGLVSAIPVLRRKDYRLAIVVVRPSLIAPFLTQLAIPCRVIEPTDINALLEAHSLANALDMVLYAHEPHPSPITKS
jgi:nucleoside-triphosphatase THEP1